MVASAMELKRLGLARKPMITVPNHMLGQFSSELLTLYPSANILAATKEDFEKHKRRELMSRIATGNWDAIIVKQMLRQALIAKFINLLYEDVYQDWSNKNSNRILTVARHALALGRYPANVADTPLGTIRSLEYVAQNLEQRLAHHQHDLSDSEKKCRELETKLGQPFEHETKLQSFVQRQQELENALDITKNQAASSLSAEVTEQEVEQEKEVESVQTAVRQSHKISAPKTTAKMRVALSH
jgi:Skp family chaperone for outer membrane proteins